MAEVTRGDKLMEKLRNLSDREVGLVVACLIGRAEVFASHGNTELLTYIEKAMEEVKQC